MPTFRSTLLLLITIGLAAATPVQAHVLKTNGSIGAVLHIDPDDSPIVGQSATLFFEFKDKEKHFTTDQCECTATIQRDGRVLATEPVTGSATESRLTSSSFSFIFPITGVYVIQLAGQPTTSGTFQTFTLSYDVRVDRQAAAPAAKPFTGSTIYHILHYGLFGGVFLVFFVIVYGQKFRQWQARRRTHTS